MTRRTLLAVGRGRRAADPFKLILERVLNVPR